MREAKAWKTAWDKQAKRHTASDVTGVINTMLYGKVDLSMRRT